MALNRPPAYLCDPGKNTECNKNTCAANPDAKYRSCRLTLQKEYAKLDEKGEPIPAPPKPNVAEVRYVVLNGWDRLIPAPPMDFHAPDIEEDDEADLVRRQKRTLVISGIGIMISLLSLVLTLIRII